MSTWKDLINYKFIKSKKGNNFAMLQCTKYLTVLKKLVKCNLRNEKNSCQVGLSDHTGSIFPSIAALSLGAQLIEVHVCVSKRLKGLDINASITFDELKTIRKARTQYLR